MGKKKLALQRPWQGQIERVVPEVGEMTEQTSRSKGGGRCREAHLAITPIHLKINHSQVWVLYYRCGGGGRAQLH